MLRRGQRETVYEFLLFGFGGAHSVPHKQDVPFREEIEIMTSTTASISFSRVQL